MSVIAIDLFCGAGGLTHGFVKEGIDVAAGIDIDPACRYPYEKNNKATFIQKDISAVTSRTLKKVYKRAAYTVLAGCAPCQPFSLYTQGLDTQSDEQWGLLNEFLRLVLEVKPDVVTMENVPQLKRHAIYAKFMKGLEAAGYIVTSYEVHCEKIGIPQTRKRLVLFASRHGAVKFCRVKKPRRPNTVRRAIGNLRPLKAGGVDADDPFHRASHLSALNLKRIKASKPGSSWKKWPRHLVAKCHTKKKGKGYPSIYGRMEWGKPAPTITTQFFGFGSGRFGHPKQDRAISPREAAILQTFPRNYAFVASGDDIQMKKMGRLIGNAVPVRLGRLIARSILRHLEEQHAG